VHQPVGDYAANIDTDHNHDPTNPEPLVIITNQQLEVNVQQKMQKF